MIGNYTFRTASDSDDSGRVVRPAQPKLLFLVREGTRDTMLVEGPRRMRVLFLLRRILEHLVSMDGGVDSVTIHSSCNYVVCL